MATKIVGTGGSLPSPQRRRLEAAELAVYWRGGVGRGSLVEAFNVSANHVTTDFRRYRQIRRDNLVYDPASRCYRPAPAFRPAFASLDASAYLNLLRRARERSTDPFARVCGVDVEALPEPKGRWIDDLLPLVTRAIAERSGVEITYQSLSRPEPSVRRIWPHALFHTGRTWAVRALDAERNGYLDFILARIQAVAPIGSPRSQRMEDAAWNTRRVVACRPGRRLTEAQREAVGGEYGMTREADGQWVWRVELREALIPYFLDEHSLRGDSGLLELAENPSVLEFDRRRALYEEATPSAG